MQGQELLTIPLKPRAWDDGHRADQVKALRRAEAGRPGQSGTGPDGTKGST